MQTQEKQPRSNCNHGRYFHMQATLYPPVHEEEAEEDEDLEQQLRILEKLKKQPDRLRRFLQSASKKIGSHEFHFENDSFGTSSHKLAPERNHGPFPDFG